LIKFKYTGNFNKAESFLSNLSKKDFSGVFEKYGREGVQALSNSTPIDSGETSNTWDYEIVKKKNSIKIFWTNSNIVDGIPVAILLQYGHGTRSGTFVEGRNFINPAITPIFDKIAENLWKEVNSL